MGVSSTSSGEVNMNSRVSIKAIQTQGCGITFSTVSVLEVTLELSISSVFSKLTKIKNIISIFTIRYRFRLELFISFIQSKYFQFKNGKIVADRFRFIFGRRCICNRCTHTEKA